jgi:hypothetical protein
MGPSAEHALGPGEENVMEDWITACWSLEQAFCSEMVDEMGPMLRMTSEQVLSAGGNT